MARFSKLFTLNTIKQQGLVVIFYTADAEVGKNIIYACDMGNANIIEFTNRGEGAIKVFEQLIDYTREHTPHVILGVGSIVDAPTAAAYINLGANFIVGPVLVEEVARVCNARKIPYMPGCGTLTEIHKAHLMGVDICKIFPAGEIGGPAFVKNILGPMPFTEIMATGGVEPTEENLKAWFDSGVACVGMGSKLISKEIVKKEEYSQLTKRVYSTLDLIQKVKGK